jgi:hypothetical protein
MSLKRTAAVLYLIAWLSWSPSTAGAQVDELVGLLDLRQAECDSVLAVRAAEIDSLRIELAFAAGAAQKDDRPAPAWWSAITSKPVVFVAGFLAGALVTSRVAVSVRE